MNEPKFPLGQTVITPGAQAEIHPEDVQLCLARHGAADWSHMTAEDRQENKISLRNGLRIFSVFQDRKNTRFWIITEADRSSTCVLLPEAHRSFRPWGGLQ